MGFPGGSAGNESAHNAGDLGLIPGLERYPGEGKGYSLQPAGSTHSSTRGLRPPEQLERPAGQRIARRDKKAFLSDQWKEIEENNRMGKTRDLFKKIRDIKLGVALESLQGRRDLT